MEEVQMPQFEEVTQLWPGQTSCLYHETKYSDIIFSSKRLRGHFNFIVSMIDLRRGIVVKRAGSDKLKVW